MNISIHILPIIIFIILFIISLIFNEIDNDFHSSYFGFLAFLSLIVCIIWYGIMLIIFLKENITIIY